MRTGFLFTATALALAAPAAADDYTLHILHINDMHSRIEPINRFDSTCSAEDDAAGECFGGAARVKTAIDTLRRQITAEGGNVLVLDAGDQFQGSLFYTTYKGEAAAEIMNAIGFDAMAVGNHEFDDGPATLAGFAGRVDHPVISGNLDLSASNALKGRIGDHLILEVGGARIGIVSALASDTPETSSPGPNVVFADEVAALAGDVAALEAEGVNRIIALTHMGLPADMRAAIEVPGIDAIVGGHSHTLLANDGEAAYPYPVMVGDTPVVQAYAYSKYVGHLTLTFEGGDVVRAKGGPVLLDASIAPDPDLAARIGELSAPLDEMRKEVIGEAAEAIEGSREVCRARECEMGNLVADAMLDRVAGQGIDIAIQNGGGLRASIDAGPVTMGEVLTVLPFQNTLATFQLKGADVIAALENGVSQVADGAGRFPQVAGLKYAFDTDKPAGERVSDVMVATEDGWQPIDPEATYGVVSNNYMRGGGDGYDMFETRAMNAYDFGPGLEVVVADYLAENTPYNPYADGRISVK